MLTDVQLKAIMPNLPAAKLALYLPHLNRAMQTYGVVTAMRTAAFVAQLAHESGEFRWMEEIWGPTQAQRRYEPACSLATRLGNARAGDGKRFKGRGPIQITGFYNYKKYGDLLGIDLAGDPAKAATPEIAFATAGLYWQR
ncbi:MAG: glycoside hydrolase family 19 protein, partial [Burkholderiaceae bacterium]